MTKKYTPEYFEKVANYYNDHTLYEIQNNIDLRINGKKLNIKSLIYTYKSKMKTVSPEQRMINVLLRYDDIITKYHQLYEDWVERINNEYHLGFGYKWVSVYKRLKNTKTRDVIVRNQLLDKLKTDSNHSSAKCCKVLQCDVARDGFTTYLDEFENKYPLIQIDYDIIRTLIIKLEKQIYQKGLFPYIPKKICAIALVCYGLTLNFYTCCANKFTKYKVATIFHTNNLDINNAIHHIFTQEELANFLDIIQFRIEQSHSILSQPIDLFFI